MLSIIVACAENQAIGYQGSMPWHLSGDLKYFRGVTPGHTVIDEFDAAVPEVPEGFKLVSSERHEADEKNDYDYTFEVYERL